MQQPPPAAVEAEHLLAFERLCRCCTHLLEHPLYLVTIPLEGPEDLHVLQPALDEGPMCKAGLTPLTRDGGDCPYFKAAD